MAAVTIPQAFQIAQGHHQAGQLAEAETVCRQILAVDPAQPETLHLLGLVVYAAGRTAEATVLIERALEMAPASPTYHSNLGVILRFDGKAGRAVDHLRRAAELLPHSAPVRLNLGEALRAADQLDESIAETRKVLAIAPDAAAAHHNLGLALEARGDIDEALACLQKAVSLDPVSGNYQNSLANALMKTGRLEEAETSARRAISLDPNLQAAYINLGILLQLRGQYEEGWRALEWRETAQSFALPRWDGGAAPGATLLLHAEQGLGDTLHVSRYIPLAQARSGARVVLHCPAPLGRLLAQSLGSSVDIAPQDEPPPAFDCHLPLMSLPHVLGLHEPLAVMGPYLQAPRPSIPEATTGLRVGLVWAGSPQFKQDRVRSISVERLQPILEVPGVSFYSLQLGQSPPAGVTDLTADIKDFADTAALMAGLDLIISVDTAAAHLAGTLGRPVWTLLPFVPDWRWGLEGETTPWYPTMRLFRQQTRGDWDAVIQRVAGELRTLAARAT